MIAAGAPTPSTQPGSVHWFDASTGAQLLRLLSPTPTPSQRLGCSLAIGPDMFGEALAIEGDRILVGADSKPTGGIGSGAPFPYDLDECCPGLPDCSGNARPCANDDPFAGGANGSSSVAADDLVLYADSLFGTAGCIGASSTWNFQFWYRDPPGPYGAAFNTSTPLALTCAP